MRSVGNWNTGTVFMCMGVFVGQQDKRSHYCQVCAMFSKDLEAMCRRACQSCSQQDSNRLGRVTYQQDWQSPPYCLLELCLLVREQEAGSSPVGYIPSFGARLPVHLLLGSYLSLAVQGHDAIDQHR